MKSTNFEAAVRQAVHETTAYLVRENAKLGRRLGLERCRRRDLERLAGKHEPAGAWIVGDGRRVIATVETAREAALVAATLRMAPRKAKVLDPAGRVRADFPAALALKVPFAALVHECRRAIARAPAGDCAGGGGVSDPSRGAYQTEVLRGRFADRESGMPAALVGPGLKAHIDRACCACIYDEQAAGNWRVQVELCTSYTCPLWSVRPTRAAKDRTPYSSHVRECYGLEDAEADRILADPHVLPAEISLPSRNWGRDGADVDSVQRVMS